MRKAKITHNGSKIAKKRNKIANQITEDEIFVQTVYNALKVPNACLIEKLTFALTAFPEVRINFLKAKSSFIDILDLLVTKEDVSSEEVTLLKHAIENINSLEELLAVRSEIISVNKSN